MPTPSPADVADAEPLSGSDALMGAMSETDSSSLAIATALQEPDASLSVAQPGPEDGELPGAGASPPADDIIEPDNLSPTPQVAESVDPLSVETAPPMKGTTIMNDAMETAKGYAEDAKTRMQSAFSEMNDKTKSTMEKSARAFEELGDLAKGNLEAVVESSKIAAKGFESLGQEAAEFGRRSFEKTSATMKSFASIKTPTEFFQLQGELLSSTMDSFAAEASRNSEAMLKLVNEISQPISNRVSVVTEKMKSLAA